MPGDEAKPIETPEVRNAADEFALKSRALDQEAEKIALDREKFRAELEDKKQLRWSSPLVLAILAAAVGLLSNALGLFGSYLNGEEQLRIETVKQQGNLVLEAIKTGASGKAPENLRLIAKAKLLGDATKEAAILEGLKDGLDPGLPAPQAQSAQTAYESFDPASTLFDTPRDLSGSLACLKEAGVRLVARYYSQAEWKRLGPVEANNLGSAGIRIVPIYEDNPIDASYFAPGRGRLDAKAAFGYAHAVNQPGGSPIFFVVDYDASEADARGPVTAYFKEIKDTNEAEPDVSKRYKIGVYGSGLVINTMKAGNLADSTWLASVPAWNGSHDARTNGNWDLNQLAATAGPCVPNDRNVVSQRIDIKSVSFLAGGR